MPELDGGRATSGAREVNTTAAVEAMSAIAQRILKRRDDMLVRDDLDAAFDALGQQHTDGCDLAFLFTELSKVLTDAKSPLPRQWQRPQDRDDT